MANARKAMKRPAPRSRAARSQGGADERFDHLVKHFLKDPQVSQARMFGSTGLKVNGKVFAMLVKGKLVIKLPRERVEALVASKAGAYFDPGHGRLMKEWVAVGSHAKDAWLGLAKEAKDFVARGT